MIKTSWIAKLMMYHREKVARDLKSKQAQIELDYRNKKKWKKKKLTCCKTRKEKVSGSGGNVANLIAG